MAGFPPRIGNFEVIRQIGSGGMGAVYLGRDADLNRQVAIKVIREEVHDQEILDRFFREARAAAALRHPNIITIYASGQHEHQPYMAMEFVEGESLAEIIRERTRLTLDQKVAYIDQICAGLHFAHRAGIVHRDIKPANVMVDREGVVRILDFGIARIEGSAMTQDGALIGSLNYMSPEQMLGRVVDHRSDIFSVGSLAYELLSYQQAFKGTLNDGLLHRLPNEDPPPLTQLDPGLPPGIEQIVMRALQKEPDRRFQNLADMRAALTATQSGRPLPPEDRTTVIRRADAPRTDTSLDFLFAPPPEHLRPTTSTDFLLGDASAALRASTSHVYGGADERADEIPPAAEAEPPVPHSQIWEPPPHVETPAVEATPPAAAAPVASEPLPPPAAPAPPPPSTITRPPSTITRPPSTITRPPATVTRPPTARATPQAVPVARSSRKWIVIGATVAVIGAAIVAIPRFTTEPSPMERERPRVVETMERFRAAYRTRNLDGVVAVFPSLPRDLRQNMQRAFTNCLLYEVTFSGMQVELNPEATQAQVDVRSAHMCTPNSNERQTTTSREDVFTLRKQGEGWLIDSVVPAER